MSTSASDMMVGLERDGYPNAKGAYTMKNVSTVRQSSATNTWYPRRIRLG